MLDEWVATVKDELGLDIDVDLKALLDVARDAAHNVDRPAAPLTTFLLGVAAGRRGDTRVDPDLVEKVSELARRWAAEREE